MSFIEKAFLAVLYGMYLYDCLFWLAPTEQAFTRADTLHWKRWVAEPLSFTLLGRRPVLAGLLLLRPGFLRLRADAPVTERSLRKLSRRLNRLYSLQTLCRGQAFQLLVYIPGLLVMHRLTAMWPIVITLLLLTHAFLCAFATSALRSAKPKAWLTPAASLIFNPLGATRAVDIVSQAFFDQQNPAQQTARKP